MSGRAFRLARESDRAAITAFMNMHWGAPHPLVNVPVLFDYYYKADGGALRFALAEDDGALSALAGFLPASDNAHPDIWVSIWVADKAARGAGLELMAELPALTGCRTLACNNIRENTLPFYEFLGYATGRLEQFYRLAPRETYALARVENPVFLPAGGDAELMALSSAAALADAAGAVHTGERLRAMNPQKDLWYLRHRYLEFPALAPAHQYRLYAASAGGAPFALLATRMASWEGTNVLRLVDYIGLPEDFPRLGAALDRLMHSVDAEYMDCYCAGIPAETMTAAGFCLRQTGSKDIIPNYLDPPVCENTDYFYFTSNPSQFTMFKADGDQDRPNIRF